MPRNISFLLTTDQFRKRTKTVTRRLKWLNVKVGDKLMGCVKCQGIKPGEQIERLGLIVVTDVRRERLDCMLEEPYGSTEAILEGYGANNEGKFCNSSDVVEVKKAFANAMLRESLESLVTILIAVNYKALKDGQSSVFSLASGRSLSRTRVIARPAASTIRT